MRHSSASRHHPIAAPRRSRGRRAAGRARCAHPTPEAPMTLTAFTAEDPPRLKRAPFVAGMAISLADPGGPIEAFKETKATLKTVQEAAGGSRGELVGEVAREVAEDAQHRKSPLAGFKPSSAAAAGAEILDELQ